MIKFTVILLYPDSLAQNFGQETFMTAVSANSVPEAVVNARQEAVASARGACEPEDFFVIAVIAGDHPDIKDQIEGPTSTAKKITICFQRLNHGAVDAMQVLTFSTTASDEQDTTVRIKAALSAWMNTTSAGNNAWQASSEDFNIGDFSGYIGTDGRVSDPDLARELETRGIFAIEETFACSSTNLMDYDTVLADAEISEKKAPNRTT